MKRVLDKEMRRQRRKRKADSPTRSPVYRQDTNIWAWVWIEQISCTEFAARNGPKKKAGDCRMNVGLRICSVHMRAED